MNKLNVFGEGFAENDQQEQPVEQAPEQGDPQV